MVIPGAALLTWGIADLVAAGKLEEAIAGYSGIIGAASTAKEQLKMSVREKPFTSYSIADNVQWVL